MVRLYKTQKHIKVLQDLSQELDKVPAPWTDEPVNKTLSIYLYNNRTTLVNDDVFFLMRLVITANNVGAPVGNIMEIIGKKESLRRIEEAIEWMKD